MCHRVIDWRLKVSCSNTFKHMSKNHQATITAGTKEPKWRKWINDSLKELDHSFKAQVRMSADLLPHLPGTLGSGGGDSILGYVRYLINMGFTGDSLCGDANPWEKQVSLYFPCSNYKKQLLFWKKNKKHSNSFN